MKKLYVSGLAVVILVTYSHLLSFCLSLVPTVQVDQSHWQWVQVNSNPHYNRLTSHYEIRFWKFSSLHRWGMGGSEGIAFLDDYRSGFLLDKIQTGNMIAVVESQGVYFVKAVGHDYFDGDAFVSGRL